ncbi:MAG: hypothetical protein MK384_08930 [SAR202 cluster bacterium]|nr:hypothetical protein [SAR202 cluster bacterium]
MASLQHDLILTAGRVFDSTLDLDSPGAVAIQAGVITAVGPEVSGEAEARLDFPDGIILPGLVDIHAHPAPEGWKYGIDPDIEILPRGTTTILSQGDSGAGDWPQYREQVIKKSLTQVRLAISPALHGETGEIGTPTFENLEEVDVDACVSVINENRDLIWGVSVNASVNACGAADPREVVKKTLQIAEACDVPILYGNRWDPYDWPISEQLDLLRPNDVLTYCLHDGPNGIVENGKVIDAAWRARERGVLFDVGHGMSSFDFPTAELAIADGFMPDTISTDQYIRHVGSIPQHDLPYTLSKLIAAGSSHENAFKRVTTRPATVLGMGGQIGTLRVGSVADIAVLQWNNGDDNPLFDVNGNERPGGFYEATLTLKDGNPIRN